MTILYEPIGGGPAQNTEIFSGQSAIRAAENSGQRSVGTISEFGSAVTQEMNFASGASETSSLQNAAASSRTRAQHAWFFLRMAAIAGDIAAIVLAPVYVHWLRFGNWMPHSYVAQSLDLSSLTAILSLQVCKAYERDALRHPMKALQAVTLAWMGATTAVILVGLYNHASGEELPRAWVTLPWFLAAAVVAILHVVTTGIVGRLMAAGRLRERIVIVGANGVRSENIIRQVAGSGTNEITILGLFDDRRRDRTSEKVHGYPVLGNTDSLVNYVRGNRVDRVVLSLPWTAEARVLSLISKLRQLPVRIDLVPHNLIWGFHTDVGKLVGVPIVTVANQRVDEQLGFLKRVEDIVIACIFVLLLLPVFLLISVGIKLSSPGPVIFRQQRYGFNNEVFEVYKFRSMYHGRPADDGGQQASKGDPRVTLIGRILRRTSLDELPQFFNVLEGTMSIVGPRPHAIPHNIEYGKSITEYFARHNVKPGITGWAQVNGYRGETDTPEKMEKRVEFDLYYIDHWSLFFDIKIVIMTVFGIWFHKAAY